MSKKWKKHVDTKDKWSMSADGSFRSGSELVPMNEYIYGYKGVEPHNHIGVVVSGTGVVFKKERISGLNPMISGGILISF